MGPPSYRRSVVDRNVVMRRIPVHKAALPFHCITISPVPQSHTVCRLYLSPALCWHILTQLFTCSQCGRRKDTPAAQPLCTYIRVPFARNVSIFCIIRLYIALLFPAANPKSRRHHYPQTQNLCFARHIKEKTH